MSRRQKINKITFELNKQYVFVIVEKHEYGCTYEKKNEICNDKNGYKCTWVWHRKCKTYSREIPRGNKF